MFLGQVIKVAMVSLLLLSLRLSLLGVFSTVLIGATLHQPNFVVILADDLGYGDLGVYGHPEIHTPEIDRMASEGVRLTEAYSPAPTCTPSRAGLLTGRYPYRSGLVRALLPKEKWGIPSSEITLAESLKKNGYVTGLIGKWHLGGRKPFRPGRHGFDSFFGLLYSNDMTLLPLVKWPRLELFRDNKRIESPAKVKTLTRRYTEEAVQYIEKNHNRPFFLFLSHTMPHRPLRPSDEFRGRSSFGYYGDVVQELDWSTGLVLQALKDNGLDERTLVIFTSDNGPWGRSGDGKLQTRGMTGPFQGVKGTTWEGGMRVPFIARMPGRLPSGVVRRGMASLMDLFPTFIEESGGAVPGDRSIDGKNIMPMMLGHEESPHSEFYYYFRKKIFAIRSGQWKLHLFRRKLNSKGRLGDVVRLQSPELYDLLRDPGEENDLASGNAKVVQNLTVRSEVFHASIAPTLNLPSPSRSVLSGLTTVDIAKKKPRLRP
ncbi:MAG: arylsulfatase [Solibacterales bacterium]|nr:arylsulfatase [Bryobacterales bacterium]|tara:strand:- start:3737 stop:5194 length:1458 start_codon:yes stop_codon:yes gene_type:complete